MIEGNIPPVGYRFMYARVYWGLSFDRAARELHQQGFPASSVESWFGRLSNWCKLMGYMNIGIIVLLAVSLFGTLAARLSRPGTHLTLQPAAIIVPLLFVLVPALNSYRMLTLSRRLSEARQQVKDWCTQP
jgi:hypothetical protein